MAEKLKKPGKPGKSPKKGPLITAAPLSLVAERDMLEVVNHAERLRAVPNAAWPQAGSPDMRVPTYPYNSAGDCVDLGYYPYYVSQLEVTDPNHQTKQCNQADGALHVWVIVKVKA